MADPDNKDNITADPDNKDNHKNFLMDVKRDVKGKPNRKMAIGAEITSYEFTYEPSKLYHKGKVLLRNGERLEVRILKADKTTAVKIFHATRKLKNEAIATLRFTTYCDAIKSWILCYDNFDSLLDEWVIKENIQNEMRQDDLLDVKHVKLIRSLLKAIIYIHSEGLFHTGLDSASNFVVLGNEVKIINVGMKSLSDLPLTVDDAAVTNLKIMDLLGFKKLLQVHILQPGKTWTDRDLFLAFFDLTSIVRYDVFIEKLMEHSFLMTTADERMFSFFKINLHIRRQSPRYRMNFVNLLSGRSFDIHLNWDTKMGTNLRSIYDYEDEKGEKRYYNGQSTSDLLELIRNAFRHPNGNSISSLDKDVRSAHPGFLHRLHEVLCRLESDKRDSMS